MEAPIGVSIMGQAQVGPMGEHRCPQRVKVSRSTAVVDVASVGFGVDRDNPGTGRSVGARSRRRRGPMSAVDHHGQVIEPGGGGLGHVAQVAFGRILGVDNAANPRAGRPQPGSAGDAEDQILDLILGVVI